jgi:serine/threonine-protein kinase RsbW
VEHTESDRILIASEPGREDEHTVTALNDSDDAVADFAGGAIVEVRVPADGAYIATLRLTAASLAARCDLTVDDIEDLRLAVDEACALLLPHATAGGTVDAQYRLAPGELSVTASVASADGDADTPDRSGFAWSVLSALASEVDVNATQGRLSIMVSKRRETAGP